MGASTSTVDCSQLVAPTVDRSPQRSPQAVHSVLAARFRGLDVVEIGTHGGDGMNCFAQVARSATAIEVDPRPCRLLRERSASLVAQGRGNYSVVCDTYQRSALDADVYTWWREHPLTNDGILHDLQRLQRAGQLRAGARAYPLFDHKWPSDMASWARLSPWATWHANVSFDECADSWGAVRSVVNGVRPCAHPACCPATCPACHARTRQPARAPLSPRPVTLPTFRRQMLWPSTRHRSDAKRCTGIFTVAEVPIAQWRDGPGHAHAHAGSAVSRSSPADRKHDSAASRHGKDTTGISVQDGHRRALSTSTSYAHARHGPLADATRGEGRRLAPLLNIRLCAYGECARYWCVTTKCVSMLEDTTLVDRMTVGALALGLGLLGLSHPRAACAGASWLSMSLLVAPLYHATMRFLDQIAPDAPTRHLPQRRFGCEGAVFSGSCVGGGKLQVASADETRTMQLTSSWMKSYKGLVVEPLEEGRAPAPSDVLGDTNASAHLSVLAAVPGDFGCRQPAHYLFNFIMPMWDALQQLEAYGPSHTSLYLDCTGLGPTRRGDFLGCELESAPSFVQEAARVLTDTPVRSLPRLLRGASPHASRTCFGGPVLVGMPCAVLDEYNSHMTPSRIRAFRTAIMRAVIGLSPRHATPRPSPGGPPADGGRHVVYLIGRTSRRIVNAEEVLATIRAQPDVDPAASRLVHFEGRSLKEQMELMLTASVLVGIDGSGFLNALWMHSRVSTAVYIMPFGNRFVREDQGSNFFRLMTAVGVTLRQLHVDDPQASSYGPGHPCMRCLLDARKRWRAAAGDRSRRLADSGPRSASRRLTSTLQRRADGLWSTDRRCEALNAIAASTRAQASAVLGAGRRLRAGEHMNSTTSAGGTDVWRCNIRKACIDGQNTNITAALMVSVASAVREAVSPARQSSAGGAPSDDSGTV